MHSARLAPRIFAASFLLVCLATTAALAQVTDPGSPNRTTGQYVAPIAPVAATVAPSFTLDSFLMQRQSQLAQIALRWVSGSAHSAAPSRLAATRALSRAGR